MMSRLDVLLLGGFHQKMWALIALVLSGFFGGGRCYGALEFGGDFRTKLVAGNRWWN